ncbi:MAG: heme biosynthesis HemY N-terminal domain-containing protein, partial [Pseudomonadota bacterium]
LGAGALLETQGGVQIQAGGVEYTLTPLMAVIAMVLLVIGVWLFLKLFGLIIATLRFINGDETAISRYFDRNRERQGFEALSDGMMALASGEGKLAMAKAAKAERYLNRPELTNLVAAQAAEQVGDRSRAEAVYKRLLTDDRTRFVGVHGLLKQRLADGDTETALKLAEKAFAIKPKHEGTQDALLKLQAGEEDWSGARKTLDAKLKHGTLPRDVHRRRDAVLALSEAREMRLAGKLEKAQELSIEANRLSPELVPAATMAAHAYMEQSKPRYASRVLKAAWEKEPHPELAAAFAAVEPDESKDARIKRFKALTKSQSSNPETRMIMAELYISAEDFPAARRAMGDLAETDPSMRALTIMAAIERGEGADDQVVRALLTRALNAPRDPAWVCEACGEVYTTWSAVCASCGALDSLVWKRPPSSEVVPGPAPAMLPLIVGQIEDQSAAPTEEAEVLPDLETDPDTASDTEANSDAPATVDV